ncbi:MAG TPA: ComEC/Rec2 family competence protein [Propionibacteriaceae bacterium]|nr:ComEC/Rec2 family competence protein [Propionibacteriaceae bacterium]
MSDGGEEAAHERQAGLGDLRLVPLAMATWAGAWLGTVGTATALAAGVCACLAIGVVSASRRSGWLIATTLMLGMGIVAGSMYAHRLSAGPVGELAAREGIVVAHVVTTGDPRVRAAGGSRPEFLTVTATLTSVSGRDGDWSTHVPILVTASGADSRRWKSEPVGTHWRVHGRLQPPRPRSGLAAVLRVRSVGVVVAPPAPWLRSVDQVRHGLREAVRDRAPEPRALVPALVLGDTSAMTPDMTADFATSGLTHLTAVSGANLTLLLAFLLIAARWAGVRGWGLRLVGLIGVVIFVGLCRTEPSVLRAAAMGLVALAALGSGGRRAGLRNLCLATVILVMIDPFLSRSVGFTLSVLASAGIIGWAPGWTAQLHRWMPRLLAESLAVPLAAHLATMPVVAAISGQVSVVGVLANAVAGPLVAPATVLGFLAAGLSLLSGTLAACAGLGAAWSAQVIIWIASLAARLPGAAWHWPASPAALVLLCGLSLAAGLSMGQALRRPWLVATLAWALIGVLLVVPAQPGWPPRDWVVVACDVGQGDGLVVRVGPKAAVVIDTGPDAAAMRRCIDQLRISAVPLLILTHFHADHVDGLSGVLAHRPVGQIWTSPLPSPSYEASTVQQQAARAGVPVQVPAVGSEGTVGEASWLVLGPVRRPQLEDSESAVENDSSLVIAMKVRGLRLLLTGDVEPPGQQAIVASGVDLRADVLKIPHHGSARQDADFLAATDARVAIASVGLGNGYGHPAPRTVSLVRSLGMTLLRTDTQGSVAVTLRAGSIGAVTQRRG